jgi:hypothetical protein
MSTVIAHQYVGCGDFPPINRAVGPLGFKMTKDTYYMVAALSRDDRRRKPRGNR